MKRNPVLTILQTRLVATTKFKGALK